MSLEWFIRSDIVGVFLTERVLIKVEGKVDSFKGSNADYSYLHAHPRNLISFLFFLSTFQMNFAQI